MSWKITIQRAKPNPAGKDKAGYSPKPEQLLGEWVDLKNTGDTEVHHSTLHLTHTEFNSSCAVTKQHVVYWNGSGSAVLKPGQTVRVHTGKQSQAASMKAEDQNGPDMHAYAEKGNFILNNDCGDKLGLRWTSSGTWYSDDEASYNPKPKEGEVLIRIGDKLV